jgi:hypothetical protein
MQTALRRLVPLAGAAAASLALAASPALAQLPPGVTAPKPTVPEIFTLMGQYVRVAYNNAGFATLGYRGAQESVGEDWMLLEVGLTVRAPSKEVTLKREDLAIRIPDGTRIPLATQDDYAKAGYLRALNMRMRVMRDSINYFPADVRRPCTIQFFANTGQGGPQLAYDQVTLSTDRGCLGRLYFHVPGKIQTGQYWLDVSFGGNPLEVPFRILTKDEAKQFEKSWEDIKKAHDESYQQK